jgi:putative Ca2+/H+ antiporter (TMEM165/GDT1 family)
MLDVAVLFTTFGLIFIGELPDKTAIASLVLGTRYPWLWAFTGIAAAFLTHVLIAVTAGSLISLAPHRVVEAVVGVIFLVGAFILWREGDEDEEEIESELESELEGELAADSGEQAPSVGFWKVASLGYGVIFLAEWGDITQILTANLAAKYHDPLSVAVGATLALWAVGLIAILGGKTLLKVLPIKWITRVAAVIMIGFGIYSLVNAITG